MSVAKPGEDGAGAGQAERLDQLTTQQAERHRIQEQHTLVREAQDARRPGRIAAVLQVEVAGRQGPVLS